MHKFFVNFQMCICIYTLAFLLPFPNFSVYNGRMYSREFKTPPTTIVQNGKANFGSYEGVSEKVEIRGMRAPYAGIPLPAFLSNLRIKSRLNYIFNLDNYIGIASFFDFKVFGLAEFIFWNKQTGRKNAYHATMPTRRRFVPTSTSLGICSCYRKSRYIKISWGRNHQHHSLSFKIKGDDVRPNAEGFIYSSIKDDFHQDKLFVSPSPASSRVSTTWITPMNVQGHFLVNGEQVDDSKGIAAMILNRAYYKTATHTTMIYGLGTVQNRNIVFNIKLSNLDAADSDKYNENVLFVDKESTPLPPVYITHPFGINKKWIIQDTESMIDLSFTPISIDKRTFNIIALRTQYSTIYGTYEGVLLTKNGEKILLKNFPGIVYTSLLRI